MALIKLVDIQKTFRDGENRLNHVLRGVNLRVEQGDFVAIKGASGSGKTTLLSLLGTLLAPDSGRYFLNGREITGGSIDLAQVRNRQIGFVFQDHRLLVPYTVKENILLPLLADATQVDAAVEARAEELMRLTRIERLANAYPTTLSGGEASRVAVCRALIRQPLLLLADEPTGQLDRENAQNIASLFKELNQTLGTTILMVTHSDETSAYAKRILNLIGGVIQ
ncbi:MAG: ABC transporter ATP-binding protein [Parabacteroides sp.]